MVFLTFLVSIAVVHWILRKEPGLGKSNQSAPAPDTAAGNASALATLDLASLAQSLSSECPDRIAPGEVLVKVKSSQPRNVAPI